MTTLIEKDSSTPAILVITAVFLLFVGAGLGLAYAGGVFTGKADVIANDHRIADLAAREQATDAKSKNVATKPVETQIHPVVRDNGNGDKAVQNGLNAPQQADYHQQQN
jgi:hypothetical protein